MHVSWKVRGGVTGMLQGQVLIVKGEKEKERMIEKEGENERGGREKGEIETL